MSPQTPPAVLFVCTGNAGRSQMAHALCARRHEGRVRIGSAGVDPWPHLHPLAMKLMSERGISMEGHHPKGVDAVALQDMDLVVTIGDPARALLPRGRVSACRWIHWDISDPADADDTQFAEATFRATLQAIEARLPELDAWLRQAAPTASLTRAPGIGTGLWGDRRLRPDLHLQQIWRAGFRAVELNLYKGQEHFDWHSTAAAEELRQVAEDLGLAIWSIHTPDLASVAHPDKAERQRQYDVIARCIDLATTLGARVLVSHALLLGPFEDDPASSERHMDEFLSWVDRSVEPTPVRLGFENAGFHASAAAATSRLLERLLGTSAAACGFVLDSGHSQLGNDWDSMSGRLDGRLVGLHLNDNDGVSDLHLAPMEGTVDWARVRQLIEQGDYRGPIMYEVEPHGDPDSQLTMTMDAHRRIFPHLSA
jgi:arsenate-mycothiol transferase